MKQRRAKVAKLMVMLVLLSLMGQGQAWAGEGVITATVTVNPLFVAVSAPSSVTVGETFQVEAVIENRGGVKIERATATIILPVGLELAKHKAEQNLGAIPPHKRKSITWKVRAIEAGAHIIAVSASGEYAGVVITESAATTLEATEASPPWWRHLLGWIF